MKIEELQAKCEGVIKQLMYYGDPQDREAIEVIRLCLKELFKSNAERDAAIKDIGCQCYACSNYKELEMIPKTKWNHYPRCKGCKHKSRWQWKGLPEGGHEK